MEWRPTTSSLPLKNQNIYVFVEEDREREGMVLSPLNSKDKHKCFLNYPLWKG